MTNRIKTSGFSFFGGHTWDSAFTKSGEIEKQYTHFFNFLVEQQKQENFSISAEQLQTLQKHFTETEEPKNYLMQYIEKNKLNPDRSHFEANHILGQLVGCVGVSIRP